MAKEVNGSLTESMTNIISVNDVVSSPRTEGSLGSLGNKEDALDNLSCQISAMGVDVPSQRSPENTNVRAKTDGSTIAMELPDNTCVSVEKDNGKICKSPSGKKKSNGVLDNENAPIENHDLRMHESPTCMEKSNEVIDNANVPAENSNGGTYEGQISEERNGVLDSATVPTENNDQKMHESQNRIESEEKSEGKISEELDNGNVPTENNDQKMHESQNTIESEEKNKGKRIGVLVNANVSTDNNDQRMHEFPDTNVSEEKENGVLNSNTESVSEQVQESPSAMECDGLEENHHVMKTTSADESVKVGDNCDEDMMEDANSVHGNDCVSKTAPAVSNVQGGDVHDEDKMEDSNSVRGNDCICKTTRAVSNVQGGDVHDGDKMKDANSIQEKLWVSKTVSAVSNVGGGDVHNEESKENTISIQDKPCVSKAVSEFPRAEGGNFHDENKMEDAKSIQENPSVRNIVLAVPNVKAGYFHDEDKMEEAKSIQEEPCGGKTVLAVPSVEGGNFHDEEKTKGAGCTQEESRVRKIISADHIDNIEDADCAQHVAKKQKVDVDMAKQKRSSFSSTIKETSEILLVLAGMSQLRGGKEPTQLEKGLMSQARERIGHIVEKVSPKILVSGDSIGRMIENLGLNRLKEPKKSSFSGKPIMERAMETVRKIELDKQKAAASRVLSGPTVRPEQMSGKATALGTSSPLMVQAFQTAPQLQQPNPIPGSYPMTQPYMPGFPVMPPFPVPQFVHVDPRNTLMRYPSAVTQPYQTVGSHAAQPSEAQMRAPVPTMTSFQQAAEKLTTGPLSAGVKTTQNTSAVNAPLGRSTIPMQMANASSGKSSAEVSLNRKTTLLASNLSVNEHSSADNVNASFIPPSSLGHSVIGKGDAVSTDPSVEVNLGQLYASSLELDQKNLGDGSNPATSFNPDSLEIHYQGTQQEATSGLNANHAEIARAVQQVLLSMPSAFSQMEPPSKAYMNSPLICQFCKIVVIDMDNVLICDHCEKGAHLKCLQPYNQKGIPDGDWHCAQCLIASNGRPLPPKYGRIGKSNNGNKPTVSRVNHQSNHGKKIAVSSVLQQPVVSNGLKTSNHVQIKNEDGNCKSEKSISQGAPESLPAVNKETLLSGSESPKSTAIMAGQSDANSHDVKMNQESCKSKEVSSSQHSLQNTTDQKVPAESCHVNMSGLSIEGITQSDNKSNELEEQHSNPRLLDKSTVLMEKDLSERPPSSGISEDDAYHVEWVGEKLHTSDDKTYYKSCLVRDVTYKLHDYALFRPEIPNVPPYIARLQVLWEDEVTKSKWAQVNWCYYPSNIPKVVGLPTTPEKNEVYESNHGDANLVGSIHGPCQVLSLTKYNEELERRKELLKSGADEASFNPLFLCKWFYDSPKGVFHPLI